MITAAQLRAARALLGMDQRALAQAARLSLPTIQRMEASEGVIRGTVDSLVKVIAALEAAGLDLINEGDTSSAGGRGVRLREPSAVTRAPVPARVRRPGTRRIQIVARRG
jgi:transcriptional regulator with XRE-family HTH domain